MQHSPRAGLHKKSVARTWRAVPTQPSAAGADAVCLVHVGQPCPAVVTLQLLENGRKPRPGARCHKYQIKNLAKGSVARLAYGPITRAGSHQLEVALNGVPIIGSPVHIEVVPDAAHAPACDFMGMTRGSLANTCAGAAGEPFSFRVRLRDRFGNSCDASGTMLAAHKVAVEATLITQGEGSEGIVGTALYMEPSAECQPGLIPECCTVSPDLETPGELIVSLVRWRAGVYSVVVYIDGEMLPHKMHAHVSANVPFPLSCGAEGHTTCIARVEAYIELVVRDSYGNARRGASDGWELRVEESTDVSISDHGVHASSSPLPSIVQPERPGSPEDLIRATVQPVETFGTSSKHDLAPSRFHSGCHTAGDVPVLDWRVETDDNGRAFAVYTIGVAGVLPVTILYRGVIVRRSPLTLKAVPPILGLDVRRIVAGEPCTLWIALSPQQNSIGSEAARAAARSLRVSAHNGTSGEDAHVVVHDESNPGDLARVEAAIQRAEGQECGGSIRSWLGAASYARVSLFMRTSGAAWRLYASSAGKLAFGGCDIPLRVYPGRPKASEARLSAGWGYQCTAGEWYEGVLTLYDGHRNPCDGWSTSNDVLSFGLRQTEAEVWELPLSPASPNVLNRHDGTYMIRWRAERCGRHMLHLQLNGEPLSCSHQILVSPGQPDAACSSLLVEPDARIQPEQWNRLRLQVRDACGNAVTELHPSRLTMKCGELRSDLLRIECSDSADGEYDLWLFGQSRGRLTLEVGVDGIHVNGSPAIVHVAAAAAVARNCFAVGGGVERIQSITCHETSHFEIIACDAKGVRCSCGGDIFRITIQPRLAGTSSIGCHDNNDGTYSVSWTPIVTGQYAISITLGASHIRGSPYRITINPKRRIAPHTSRHSGERDCMGFARSRRGLRLGYQRSAIETNRDSEVEAVGGRHGTQLKERSGGQSRQRSTEECQHKKGAPSSHPPLMLSPLRQDNDHLGSFLAPSRHGCDAAHHSIGRGASQVNSLDALISRFRQALNDDSDDAIGGDIPRDGV